MKETGKLIQAEVHHLMVNNHINFPSFKFRTFKQDIKKDLKQEGDVKYVMQLVREQLLKEWLTTGVGLLRNVVGYGHNFTG